MSTDQQVSKWLDWMEQIYWELQELTVARRLFWGVQDIIKANPRIQKPNAFFQFLGAAYASHSVAGCRRLLKWHKDSISLVRLLGEIAEHPKKIDRRYYRALYRKHGVEELADPDFEHFAEPGSDHVSVKMVQRDLAGLQDVAAKIEDFADRRVAHRDQREPKTLPTFNDVNTCIETMDKTFVKYHQLLNGNSFAGDSVDPVFQYDWKTIFREPWIRPD